MKSSILNLIVPTIVCSVVTVAISSPSFAVTPTESANALLEDLETVARLSASGKLLYEADEQKAKWDKYCAASGQLANRGEFRAAIREASKALFLGEQTNNATAKAYAARDLAYAYNLANDGPHARDWADKALLFVDGASLSRSEANTYIRGPVKKTLADVNLREGKSGEAIKLYREALDQMSQGDSGARQFVQLALANALRLNGERDELRKLLSSELKGADSAAVRAGVSRIEAELLLEEGKTAEAVAAFTTAAAKAHESRDAYLEVFAQDGVARAYSAGGDSDAALTAMFVALDTIEQVRAEFRSDQIRAGFFNSFGDVFDRAIEMTLAAGKATEAFAVSERSRARVFIDQVRGRIPNARGLLSVAAKTSSVHDIQAAVPKDSVLVSYHVLPQRTIVFIVRANALRAVSLTISAEELSRVIASYRRAIVDRSPSADDIGQTLYRQLIEPLDLKADEGLILVPHRMLHLLPFQALRNESRYLIEERKVSYQLAAGGLVGTAMSVVPKGKKFFGLGNPDLANPVYDLPGSEIEVRDIAKLFPDSTIYLRGDATKSRVLAESGGQPILHFATHAIVDEQDPLFSVVKLAGNGAGTDLEAREFYQLDLGSTRVVTLSACNSGLGKVAAGDEFYGFKRTILASGSRSLLVSLWPVDDSSTAVLMTIFYGKAREAGLADALRAAQLELIKRPERPESGAPVYWAAFTLVGSSE